MEVYLASPRGFCAGVARAIDVVALALKHFGPPVYVKHQIVHNPYVVASLERMGAVTVDDPEDVPNGEVVVFSAHGSPPSDYEKAKIRGLNVIDATCPLVTKVHNEARKYAREERGIILVGHRGHQEVKGTLGHANMVLIDDREPLNLPNWAPDRPVTVLTQTTLSVDDTQRAIQKIRGHFSNASVRNDICYATTNRQESAKALAQLVQLVLVIGAQNSSNCNRLRDVVEGFGIPAHLINGPEDLHSDWFEQVDRVGITSGASTPESLVDKVIEALKPERVVPVQTATEDISFTLPKSLREWAHSD